MSGNTMITVGGVRRRATDWEELIIQASVAVDFGRTYSKFHAAYSNLVIAYNALLAELNRLKVDAADLNTALGQFENEAMRLKLQGINFDGSLCAKKLQTLYDLAIKFSEHGAETDSIVIRPYWE
jgi:hypothetical protein